MKLPPGVLFQLYIIAVGQFFGQETLLGIIWPVAGDVRGEFFNTFNHAQFMNPGGNVVSSHFGVVTGARDPRIGQVAVKIHF